MLAWLPSLVCGMMIEMVPFEDGSLDQEQFEAKYADVSYPVRAQYERTRRKRAGRLGWMISACCFTPAGGAEGGCSRLEGAAVGDRGAPEEVRGSTTEQMQGT